MKIINFNKNSFFEEILIILTLIIIALSIRLFFLQFRQVIETDGYFYATCGKNLIEGKGFTNMDGTPHLTFSPLPSLLIGIFWLIFKDLELAGRMVSILSGSFLILPVYLFAKNLWNKKIAILTSFLVIFYPGLVNISTQVGSDSLYTFVLVSMIYIFWLALNKKENSWLYFISVGFMLGLCYLARAIGFVYFLVISLWTGIFFLFKRKNARQLVFNIIICFIAFLIVSSPYLVFIYKQTNHLSLVPEAGRWLSILQTAESEEELEIAKTSISGVQKIEIKDKYSLLGYFKQYPKLFAVKFIKGIFLFYKRKLPDEIPSLIIIFIGLGLLGIPFNKEKFKKDIFLLSLAFPLSIQAFWGTWGADSRYIIPLTPFVLVLTSLGLYFFKDNFLNSLEINSSLRRIIFILTVTIIIISFFPSILKIAIQKSEEPIEHKEAGLWLKQFDNSKPLIMSRKPWVAFYSEGIWICLPYGTYEEIINYAKKNKVKYLVIDEMLITKLRPQLTFLLKESRAPVDLELIYKDKFSGRSILIYKLSKQILK